MAGATGYGVWPDNSLEGARQCLAAPVDGIEIDVQMTADGRVVAHHDYSLKPDATRLDGRWLDARSPPLKTLTLDTLRPYDVGALRPGSDYAARYPHRQPLDLKVGPWGLSKHSDIQRMAALGVFSSTVSGPDRG